MQDIVARVTPGKGALQSVLKRAPLRRLQPVSVDEPGLNLASRMAGLVSV